MTSDGPARRGAYSGEVKYGISVPNFGQYSDPTAVTELAILAEDSGWDGFFVWDHIVISDGTAVADPWVVLASIARSTETIELGSMVTPVPRRRPWVLARQATTVDHLSGGRLVLGVGIGFPPDVEFGTFGEPVDERERADMLDEGLEILEGMWSGETFSYEGRHYRVEPTTFGPRPVQQPRIPIWVAAGWGSPRPIRRSCRFDGVFPVKWDMTDWEPSEVEELREMIVRERGHAEGFEVVIGGSFEAMRQHSSNYENAGATWFLTGPGQADSIGDLNKAIAAGARS